MRNHPVFFIYGILMLLTASFAEYRGYTLFRPDQVRGNPKTIRDNPGIYRSIYSGYGRYSGGK